MASRAGEPGPRAAAVLVVTRAAATSAANASMAVRARRDGPFGAADAGRSTAARPAAKRAGGGTWSSGSCAGPVAGSPARRSGTATAAAAARARATSSLVGRAAGSLARHASQIRMTSAGTSASSGSGRRFDAQVRGQDLGDGLRVPRHPAGERAVEHQAQPVHVGRGAHQSPSEPLRGDEGRRPEQVRLVLGLADGGGDAEVDELGAGPGQHHVGRLHVAVHHAVRVGLGQGGGDLGADSGRLGPRYALALVQAPGQRHARDQLHHDVRGAVGVGLAVVEDTGDVWMRRAGPPSGPPAGCAAAEHRRPAWPAASPRPDARAPHRRPTTRRPCRRRRATPPAGSGRRDTPGSPSRRRTRRWEVHAPDQAVVSGSRPGTTVRVRRGRAP